MESDFDPAERRGVYRAIGERRDMRHFLSTPIDAAVLGRLISAAHQAPSVGYMQPWRFVRIRDSSRRAALVELVEREREATAEALGERGAAFMRLKVEGLRECAEVLVVALAPDRERYLFGRRTLPQMDLASASCAIQNLWLAARAEGLGMGWVSLFEPSAVREVIQAPEGVEPIAILCLGHVERFYPRPMLELEGWDRRRPLDEVMMEERWNEIDR